MKLIFKNPRTFQRMHEGPLGLYIDSYAAEMREQGYCAGAMESQIRLLAHSELRCSINPRLPTGWLSGIKTLRCHYWNVMNCPVGDRGLLRRALSTRMPQRWLWNKSSRCAFTSMNRVIEMAHYACFLERT